MTMGCGRHQLPEKGRWRASGWPVCAARSPVFPGSDPKPCSITQDAHKERPAHGRGLWGARCTDSTQPPTPSGGASHTSGPASLHAACVRRRPLGYPVQRSAQGSHGHEASAPTAPLLRNAVPSDPDLPRPKGKWHLSQTTSSGLQNWSSKLILKRMFSILLRLLVQKYQSLNTFPS